MLINKKNKIFLSHSSKDKSFVRKLATDLKLAGCEVWYDEWEIKVGDSLVEKVTKGINENEYLAVILSKNSIESEWVKKELSLAAIKEIQTKNIVILPILKEECEIPFVLADKKYANFKKDYDMGFSELLLTLGINKLLMPQTKLLIDEYRNGNSWYKKFENNTVEQGSKMSIKSNMKFTVTFLIPFNEQNYDLYIQQLNYTQTNYFIKIIEKTTTKFTLIIESENKKVENIDLNWVAKTF